MPDRGRLTSGFNPATSKAPIEVAASVKRALWAVEVQSRFPCVVPMFIPWLAGHTLVFTMRMLYLFAYAQLQMQKALVDCTTHQVRGKDG